MKKLYIFFIIAAGICVVLIALSSPVFQVTELSISGNEKISSDAIGLAVGFHPKVNFFAIDAGKAKGELMKNIYVEDAVIKKSFPNKITVKITERRVSGYVKYLGDTFLYIDENGRVLETNTYFDKKLPVIVGLSFQGFELGSVLPVDNKAAFDTVVTLAKLFNKNEMADDVIRVDVSDSEDIHLFMADIDVEFGNSDDADEKVRTIKAIMAQPEMEGKKGFLDIRDLSKAPRFSLLK